MSKTATSPQKDSHSQPQGPGPTIWRWISIGAQAKLLRQVSELWLAMKDDLIADSLVQWVFLTFTYSKLLLALLFAAWVGALHQLHRYRRRDAPSLGFYFTAQFVLMWGIMWFALPHARSLSRGWMVQFAIWPAVAGFFWQISRLGWRTRSQSWYLLLGWVGLSLMMVGALSWSARPVATGETCPAGDACVTPTVEPRPTPAPTPKLDPATTSVPTPSPASPTPYPTLQPAVTPTLTPTPTAGCPPLALVSPPAGATYFVQQGDSLAALAARYGVTVEQLVQANVPFYPTLRQHPECIREGWYLIIPDPADTP